MRSRHAKLTVCTFFILYFSFFIGGNIDTLGAEKPVDVSAFRDGANHWYNLDNSQHNIQPLPGKPQYKPAQVREIADNILLYQRASGGWPKNYDMLAILTDAQRAALARHRNDTDTTIDNRNTHSQITYLARAYSLLRDERYRDAVHRGLDFLSGAQLPSGGFPQKWPLKPPPQKNGYFGFITYNDGVTIGMLTMFRNIANADNGFEWLDETRRAQAREIVARGTGCLLKTQYVNKQGILQGWGQQHDPATLKPAKARPFEHPCICSTDTAEIARYLMGFDSPPPEVIRSIRAAVAWLRESKITGKRLEKFTIADPKTGKTQKDQRLVDDPGAGPLWARMYELETNRPIYSDRTGVIRYDLSEIDRERRTGYGWIMTSPNNVITKLYNDWLKKNNLPK